MRISPPRPLLPCLLALSLASGVSARGSDAEKSSAETEMAKIAALGAGVHAIQKDKQGRITSCVVVGQSRISTVLGKSKGLDQARKRANLAASAEFVKWLKESVTVVQDEDNEQVTLLEGRKEGNERNRKESGKAVERSSDRMTSISEGLVRGLQVLHVKTDGEDETLTVVKGWKAETSEGVKKIASDSKSDRPKSAETPAPEVGDSGKADKEIRNSETTSPDAGDFLPKRKPE